MDSEGGLDSEGKSHRTEASLARLAGPGLLVAAAGIGAAFFSNIACALMTFGDAQVSSEGS